MSDCCPDHAGSRGRCRGTIDTVPTISGIRPPEWIDQAGCRNLDPETFFPEPSDKPAVLAATLVCSECPVRPQCETHYIDERYGIFGGRTPKEREDIRFGLKRPWTPARWFACPHCGRDVATRDPRQKLCGSETCLANQRRRYDIERRGPGKRRKAS